MQHIACQLHGGWWKNLHHAVVIPLHINTIHSMYTAYCIIHHLLCIIRLSSFMIHYSSAITHHLLTTIHFDNPSFVIHHRNTYIYIYIYRILRSSCMVDGGRTSIMQLLFLSYRCGLGCRRQIVILCSSTTTQSVCMRIVVVTAYCVGQLHVGWWILAGL